MKVLFMGSAQLSCTFLTALIHAPDMDVVGVFSQPDKPQGRHLTLKAGPVKELALAHCVPVFTPQKINSPDSMQCIKDLAPDVIVVMAYGQFLKKELLDFPKFGCVNLHVSILPKLRGAAPIQRAILNGDKQTGVTAMLMDVGMDTGDILDVITTEIKPDDTSYTLGLRMAIEGSDLMLDVLRKLKLGTATRTPQDHSLATHAPKVMNTESLIEWSCGAEYIDRLVRAFNPKPYCHTFLPPQADAAPNEPGALLKILKTRVESRPQGTPEDVLPGTVLSLKKGPLIATGEGGALRILEVQVEGKPRPMSGADFSNGCRKKLDVGSRLYPGINAILNA